MKSMKKIFLIILFTISFLCKSQKTAIPSDLKFDTKYFDAKDKWVAFPKAEKDSSYLFGFVYLDNMAGFTFHTESMFYVDKNGIFVAEQADKSLRLISRLQKNTGKMALLSAERQKQLSLPAEPDWLNIYNTYDSQVEKLTRFGFHLNAINASESALDPLLKANKINPNFKGLAFELAFAYNHLGQFEKAVPIVEKALIKDSKNDILYKELGFSLLHLKRLSEAEVVYNKGINVSDSDAIKAEMAINITSGYFAQRNKTKFDEWCAIARKYSSKNATYMNYLKNFEDNW